jgi:hypothetical protein
MILGIAGKKRSGKNTLANHIYAHVFKHIGFDARINELGQLMVKTENGGEGVLMLEECFRRDEKGAKIARWLHETIWPNVKSYAFADPLKAICMDFFGLTWEQCYGDNKNTSTTYNWNTLPSVLTLTSLKNSVKKSSQRDNIVGAEDGEVTARQFLQFLGTDIFRKIRYDCWVQRTLDIIKVEKPLLSLITDVRFDNEAEAIRQAGGRIIVLTRDVCERDGHESERGITVQPFDIIIDNQNMSVEEQGKAFDDLKLIP